METWLLKFDSPLVFDALTLYLTGSLLKGVEKEVLLVESKNS